MCITKVAIAQFTEFVNAPMRNFFMDYQKTIISFIQKHTQLSEEFIINSLEIPPKHEMGDFAFPCFSLARQFRKNPTAISQFLAQKSSQLEGFQKIIAIGPYLNFFVNRQNFAKHQLSKILTEKSRIGFNPENQKHQILIEYSSPNVCKKFHIGHIATTIIGGALEKIYNHLGYRTVSINHLGDYGTQFGKQIVAFQKWGNKEAFEKNPIDELLRIYVKFHEEAENSPELEEEARQAFAHLEQGKPEYVSLFKQFREKKVLKNIKKHTKDLI